MRIDFEQIKRMVKLYLKAVSRILLEIGEPFGSNPSIIAARVAAETIRELLGVTEEQQQDIHERATQASQHLIAAGTILSELQTELQQRNEELTQLLNAIDTHKGEAEHWNQLATANQQLATAFVKEMERRISEKLRAELDRNKRKRQLISIGTAIFLLILGAVIGAVFQQYYQTGNPLPPWIPTPTPFP